MRMFLVEVKRELDDTEFELYHDVMGAFVLALDVVKELTVTVPSPDDISDLREGRIDRFIVIDVPWIRVVVHGIDVHQ